MSVSEKHALRTLMQNRRPLFFHDHPDAAFEIAKLFFDFFTFPPQTILGGYWPIGSELDSRPLLHELIFKGFSCALPCLSAGDLFFREWRPSSSLIKGDFQIFEPAFSCPLLTPSVIFMPLLAFDRQGNRLGYGQGHYDRYLQTHKALKIGLAFQEQEVASLPPEPHDIPLDYVITNASVIECHP